MLALEKSSIASSNSNKATLSQDILTTKRKRCMSIDERNQFVGKRLKIVYIATLPQNLTKLPRNSQIGNALSMAKPETINSDTNTKLGTTKNTDKIQINNENNQIASEWNDKVINGDMLKWNKNVNTTNSQVLQSQNPMQYSTSKECKKYTTSTGGSTITGTEKEGCTLSGAKVILSKQTHASHATDNISMDINGTENSPRILNSSQVIGTIDSGNIPCEYGQKINESMQKDPFMLSDRNTIDKEKLSRSVILKSQIRNHDRIDTNNGSAVASAENTSIDNVNCIELTRIPVKLEKQNVVADSSNISCPNSKSGSERSTSYLNSTSRWPHEKSNNNKKQSVVNISTISQKDLMKFLSRYNLTLKAVPENTSCTVNMGLAKFRTVSVDSNRQNSHLSSLGQLSDASNAKTFILSDSETIQNKFQPGSNETGKNPVANRKLRYEGNTIFRSTPQGTFSDWKIEGARSAKLCKRRSRVRFNGNIGRICKKSMKIRNSACFEYTETGNKNLLKKSKIADVAQPTVSTYNRSETPDTSGFECPFKMFPLSNAFRDLELRDKATRETLETSKDFNNSVSVGSATGQYLRTLSPTMTSLFNDGSCLLNAGEFHADPVLTSAVAFNSTETVAGDLSDDFVINQVLLSPVVSKNKSLTCRNFTCLKRKTSVLEKEDITTSSSEDNKSQSVGESTNITELASENLYGFPVSDMEDEASNSIPSIDLSAPKCSVGDSSTKYCVKRSKSTTTRDNIAMTLKSNKYGCNNSTNKSNLCHRGTKNCVSTVSSATLSSCHCSTDACVVSHDSNTSSRSERTQVGTEFNKKNKDITQQQLSKYPTKAIEKWSSEEVASWLNDTIRHYELDKTSLCTNLDSKNVENQKRTGNIFSGSFLNGRALT
uniref:uncharacterized protein LOC120343278 n=1 Tax=Styela clava TaxID=7725 RepID=UPI0019397D96|nr:uncharacterized protein LOC120343278 [Styela clava]